jgi:hypothetical protein
MKGKDVADPCVRVFARPTTYLPINWHGHDTFELFHKKQTLKSREKCRNFVLSENLLIAVTTMLKV